VPRSAGATPIPWRSAATRRSSTSPVARGAMTPSWRASSAGTAIPGPSNATRPACRPTGAAGVIPLPTPRPAGAGPRPAAGAGRPANRCWTDDNHVYARLDWRKDNFGGVREEWVPSVGYGGVILRKEQHDPKGEVGAGYRTADLADGTTEEGIALSGGLRYLWQISATAEFFENVLVQWSQDNTYLESETGLRTNIIGNLSAKISYLVKHNTDVPAGLENTDFFTNIGLEYQF